MCATAQATNRHYPFEPRQRAVAGRKSPQEEKLTQNCVRTFSRPAKSEKFNAILKGVRKATRDHEQNATCLASALRKCERTSRYLRSQMKRWVQTPHLTFLARCGEKRKVSQSLTLCHRRWLFGGERHFDLIQPLLRREIERSEFLHRALLFVEN